MAQQIFIRTSIILFFITILAGCLHMTRIGQPFMAPPHPGKYQLVYYPPTKEFPLYSMVTVDGREFLVGEDVVPPSVQSLYLLTYWKVFEGESVLDLGTGSGVQAVFAADKASRVVATDINPVSVTMARMNVERNGVDNIVEVRQGDLFAPIKEAEKFDVILFNIEYPHNEESLGLWQLHERFFAEVKKHLNRGGRLYYQSGNIENAPRVNTMASKNGMSVLSMRMDASLETDTRPIVYLIKRSIDLEVDADAGKWNR